MTSNDQNLMNKLLPAMQNVQNALNDASLGGKIKVSTVHPMGVLKKSEPPSSGSFDPSYGDLMKGLLEFNSATGSPFAINPSPYFAYRSDTRPETLVFCLFQPNAGRLDGNTKIKYMNMFDARVDAVYSALNSMGFKNVEIVVAETGWPFKGDDNDVGPSIENAQAYNGNLIAHLRSMVGTPLMPGKSVDTFLFALYDGDSKPGPGSERSFGLYKTDLTMVYDVGLSTSSQTRSLAAAQQLLAAATNTSTDTNNNNSSMSMSTSTSTSTETSTSTSTSSSMNNISIINGSISGSSSNKVHLNRIFNLGKAFCNRKNSASASCPRAPTTGGAWAHAPPPIKGGGEMSYVATVGDQGLWLVETGKISRLRVGRWCSWLLRGAAEREKAWRVWLVCGCCFFVAFGSRPKEKKALLIGKVMLLHRERDNVWLGGGFVSICVCGEEWTGCRAIGWRRSGKKRKNNLGSMRGVWLLVCGGKVERGEG
ncbi:uncharacterized protein [Populus alba]|uniref:uncharacterized protein n=1 Tax=Populus alba TaxID=43335 RepID=UPI003CC70E01